MVISRWRTGGANSLAFSRNYFQRLSKMSTAEAFKESLAAAREMNLNYAIEPLVRSKSNDAVVKAVHPYFWAPYMRFDIPLAEKPAAAQAILNPDPDAMAPDDQLPPEVANPAGEMGKKDEGEIEKKEVGDGTPTEIPDDGKKDE
jgi:hypothetical protein